MECWGPQIFCQLPSSVEFWSGIIGALLGAIVGGLVAFFLQVSAYKKEETQNAKEKKQSQCVFCISIMIKILRIYSNINHINEHINRCHENNDKNKSLELWQVIVPFASFPKQISFDSSELSTLVEINAAKFVQYLITWEEAHNSIVSANKEFSDRRRTLTECLVPDGVNGTVFFKNLTQEQSLPFRQRMVELNSVMEEIVQQSNMYSKEILLRAPELNSILTEKVGLSLKFEVSSEAGDAPLSHS